LHIVVQIPCLNEEATIAEVIADIRAHTAELGQVSILVIDDGSTDGTVEAARAAGADYVARHNGNQGLARGYMTGLAAALNLGADVIVNTDADNQYSAASIPDLVAPILEDRADLVVGCRPIRDIEHFSPVKKRLQLLGSAVVRGLSRTSVRDATSGFRALNRETALQTHTFGDYTYTLETLIQAGANGLRVASVEIGTNGPTRTSRLIRSIPQYVMRSALDMLRVYAIYAPLRAYLTLSTIPLGLSFLLGLRYLFLITFVDATRSHAPSLILAGILAGLGFMIVGLGIIGENVSVNRRILEDARTRTRRVDAEAGTLRGRVPFTLTRLGPGARRDEAAQ
jgi:glycosyltransferase involved in cell wall biosynthesis